MATRSYIGYIDRTNGNVYFQYCHFDGYPEYNGRILQQSWTSYDDVVALVHSGELTSLGTTIANCERPSDAQSSPAHAQSLTRMRDDYCHGVQYTYVFDTDNQWLAYTDRGDRLTIPAAADHHA